MPVWPRVSARRGTDRTVAALPLRAGGGPAPYLATAERARTVRGGSCCGHSAGTQARLIVEGRGAHFVLAEVPRHAPAGAAALPEPRVLTPRQHSKRMCAWETRQRGKGRGTAGRPLRMRHAIGAVRIEGTRMRLSGTPSTHQSTMDHSSSSLFWIGVPVRPARYCVPSSPQFCASKASIN